MLPAPSPGLVGFAALEWQGLLLQKSKLKEKNKKDRNLHHDCLVVLQGPWVSILPWDTLCSSVIGQRGGHAFPPLKP